MKTTKITVAVILCIIALICLFPASSASAETGAFRIRIKADENFKPGETVNIICSVAKIVPDPGLIAVSFTLTYDTKILEPVVVSSSADDTSPYDAFMKKVPTYTLASGGTEVQVPAYENISRCFPEKGQYLLTFVDMIAYPGIKEGTTVDSVLKKDGDLTLSIPFKVKEGTTSGAKAVIRITDVKGTTAGEAMKTVTGSDTSVTMSFEEKGIEVITTAEAPSDTAAASGDGQTEHISDKTSPAGSESKAPTTNATGNAGTGEGTDAGTGEVTSGRSEEKGNGNSALIIIIAIISVLAVIAVVFVYLKKKSK